MRIDVLILGGGAAGLMCAIAAGRRGRRVLVLDHAERVGKKILMSGGGRCNFTHLGTSPANYLCANPHFAKSALARYTPSDFVALVEKHRIAYHEKDAGQLFCNDSSKQIVRMLLDECAAAGVRIQTGCAIDRAARVEDEFEVATSRGALRASSLVVATGGLSIPRMGATGFGYALARSFGHAVRPTRAGLVPFTVTGQPLQDIDGLAGVAVSGAAASVPDRGFDGAVLFTHRGVSGPAVLQVSSYWQQGQPLTLDFAAGIEVGAWLAERRRTQPAQELKTALADLLPKSLAQRCCELVFGNRPLRQHDARELAAIGARVNAWPLTVSGTEGYRTAEVTLGGVDTDGLSSTTMASRHVPGLYFIGEVVDVTGWLGGYNFQWAWASAHAAGQVV